MIFQTHTTFSIFLARIIASFTIFASPKLHLNLSTVTVAEVFNLSMVLGVI
jgi:hypothetical protein